MTPEETDLVLALLARVPQEQREALREALAAGWRIESNWQKIRARYQDLDLADAVPRVILYLDLGVLIGRLIAYQRAMAEQGFEFAEED